MVPISVTSPTRATMLYEELAAMLPCRPSSGDSLGYGAMEKHGLAPGAARGAVPGEKPPAVAAGEVPGYLHELRGSPAHRLGGRDQPFRPARVLGVKLLSCCCPLLL